MSSRQGKRILVSVPRILNDNHSLPRWLELINIFHPIVTQLLVKYALKPISLLSGRNVQLLKASWSMQVSWRQKFEVTHYLSTKRLNRPGTYTLERNFQPLYQNHISQMRIKDVNVIQVGTGSSLTLAELTRDLPYLHVCNSCYSVSHLLMFLCFTSSVLLSPSTQGLHFNSLCLFFGIRTVSLLDLPLLSVVPPLH